MISIYYVSGRGGALDRGLGAEIQTYAHQFFGRAVSGDFEKLDHAEQVQTIREDLGSMPDDEPKILVAHSYGAYLLLHALIRNPHSIDTLLLISPVTGAAMGNGRFFRPPGTKVLSQALADQTISLPKQGALLTGELDWQSPADRGKDVALQLGIKFTAVPNTGHRLPAEIIKGYLDAFLAI